MGHIFRNLKEIPIPKGALVNTADARVFIMFRDKDNKRRRRTIGLATSPVTMHPNENFKYFYPDLWRLYYGDEKLLPHQLHVGLYGLTLSIGSQTGLYALAQKDFGPLHANALFDYIMFSMRERSNSTNLMQAALSEQLTFSTKLPSDAWYSNLFEKKLSADDIHKFRCDWLKHCAAQGCKDVWLCVDGSNNDCAVSHSDLAEPGNAKSHRPVNIYSYIWAVNANDGRPVTWFVNNGGKVDAKAFEKIARFLASSGIQIKGVILDRGFAQPDVFKLILDLGYQYIAMLKSSVQAFQSMLTKYSDTIRWKVDHLIGEGCEFGTAERVKVFGNSNIEACVALLFDGSRASRKATELIEAVLQARREAETQLAAGRKTKDLRIAANLRKYLRLKDTGDSLKVDLCTEKLQAEIDSKGYCAIASSLDMSAGDICRNYQRRIYSEIQYSFGKSQLGDDVTRVHYDRGIEAKLAVAFMASIVRTELELKCRELKLDTNKSIRESDRSVVALMTDDQYVAIHDQSDRMRKLFAAFGLTDDHLDSFADEANARQNPMHSQTRTMPPFAAPAPKRGPGRPPKNKTQTAKNDKPKRGRGRPKGSKNKKTLEREAQQAKMPPKPKRKPGRPKGSKNKKTLAREAAAAATVKRGRGRPRGSKNKKTLEKERQQAELAKAATKKK